MGMATYDPRKDIVDTCLKSGGVSDITFTDENSNVVTVNIGYEEEAWDEMALPLLVIRGVRPVEEPTSVGWNTYQRIIEFDISFYMVDSDDVDVREDKREVLDNLVQHIKDNQGSVTLADTIRVTSVVPENDFDRQRKVYGFTATIEAIQKD
jgi:hypothetical protein